MTAVVPTTSSTATAGELTALPVAPGPGGTPEHDGPGRRSGRAGGKSAEDNPRGLVSGNDRRRGSVRITLRSLDTVLLLGLIVLGLGPMLWLVKSAVTPTQDTLRSPLAIFPNGIAWSQLATAWNDVQISLYFWNTVVLALGSWLAQMLVATTAGYLLSVLRPRYAKVLEGLVLATLFVPAVVLLVPLYLTILNPPLIGTPLINTYWAVWLPAGANAFNVLLVKRFFDSLPREVFEAARTDGAGNVRLFVSIVLPLSKPILGVVSVFAIINSWKDFLWPLLVLPQPDLQPLSVRLPSIQSTTELGVFLAALAISTLIPVVLFLIFQRTFLRSAGLGGAIKG